MADRVQRLFRFTFLNEAEQRIDDNHTQNDGRVQPEPDHQLDESGGKQNIDQDVVQLHEKPHERPSLASLRQLVSPVLLEPARNFVCVKAGMFVAVEPSQYLIRGNGMPCRSVAGIRIYCCSHKHTGFSPAAMPRLTSQVDDEGHGKMQEMCDKRNQIRPRHARSQFSAGRHAAAAESESRSVPLHQHRLERLGPGDASRLL